MNTLKRHHLATGEAADDLRRHLLALYRVVLETPAPPENLIGGFLRKSKSIRGGARGFLASTVFALLRHRIRTRLWRAIASGGGNLTLAEAIRAVETCDPAVEALDGVVRWLREDLDSEPTEYAQALAALSVPVEEPASLFATIPACDHLDPAIGNALRYSLHPELARRWAARFAEDFPVIASGVTTAAELHIWLASPAASDAARAALLAAGIPATAGRFLGQCLRLGAKRDLARVPGLDGVLYTVQDEGSQLIAAALGDCRGWKVLDACAGAGGKTLNLSAAVGENGIVVAHDASEKRLAIAEERLREAGIRNVRFTTQLDAEERFDAVLIDAPCSGLGTIRRDPSLQWRAPLSEQIASARALQKECLDSYTKLLKPGGILVYATCSIEPEETSDLLAEGLGNDFIADPLPEIFSHPELSKWQSPDHSQIIIPPHLYGTDGFFVGRYLITN